MRTHLRPAPGLPYAPCGARVNGARTTGNPREVNCGNCQNTRLYIRARILALPSATPIVADDHVQYRYLLGDDGYYHDVKVGPFTPEPGGTWPYGDWKQAERDYTGAWPEPPTHVMLGYTGYSDYSGSSVDRSNNEALRDDYPDTFTEAIGGHGTSELMLSVDWHPPADGREGLLDALEALEDYPLYDEGHHSMLETEAATEAWDQWLSSDVPRALEEASPSAEALEDALEAIEELAGQHGAEYPQTTCKCGETFRNWDDILAHLDKFPSLERMFYDTLRDQDSSPYLETAVDVVFPYMDDSVAQIEERIWRLRCADLPQRPGWFNPAQPALAGMPVIAEDDES